VASWSAIAGERLVIRVKDSLPAQVLLANCWALAQILCGWQASSCRNAAAVEHPDEMNSILVKGGFSPTHLVVEEEDLEQYFLRLVGMNGGSQHG